MTSEKLDVQRLKQRRGEIFPLYEVFYIEALRFHCSAAASAILQIAELCGNDVEIRDAREGAVLDEAQRLILHAGSISRFFWPVRRDHAKRGEQLRTAFQIAEFSPLADRSLRDGLEHFDERLDLYLCRDIVGYIFPTLVGDLSTHSDVPVHRFRAFDPKTGVFEMLGEQYRLHPIVEELLRIREALRAMRPRGRFSTHNATQQEGA